MVLRTREGERGSSLVEAVITLGLLAGVLLSSLGLFTFGERQLRSARASSHALAAARSILEEMSAWTFAECWGRLGLDGSAASYAVDTRANPAAAAWQSAFQTEIPGAFATVRVESLPFGGVTEPLDRAKGLRIVVVVEWDETGRRREVRLGTARF